MSIRRVIATAMPKILKARGSIVERWRGVGEGLGWGGMGWDGMG